LIGIHFQQEYKMSKTIYWAVKLDDKSRVDLLIEFPAIHPNVYAEHMTVLFGPSASEDEALMQMCGTKVKLKVVGYREDEKGQAVVVKYNISRTDGGTNHITVSCADGVRPVYSNQLLQNSFTPLPFGIILDGTIARFTDSGWDLCESDK